MVTLDELLELAEVKRITLYAPVTPRIDTRLDFDPNDSAILDDISKMYGHLAVRRIGPIFKGDERIVIKLGKGERS